MLDHFYIIAVYSDNVKPDPSVEAMIGFEIYLCGAYDVKLFPGVDRLEGCPEILSLSPFYLYKNQVILILGNDIDLSKNTSIILGHNSITLLHEDICRQIFSFVSREPFITHNIL